MKWYISKINDYNLQDEEAQHDLDHIQEKLVGKLVHIGKTPPENKDILWVDTRNFFDDEANIDNIPNATIPPKILAIVLNRLKNPSIQTIPPVHLVYMPHHLPKCEVY